MLQVLLAAAGVLAFLLHAGAAVTLHTHQQLRPKQRRAVRRRKSRKEQARTDAALQDCLHREESMNAGVLQAPDRSQLYSFVPHTYIGLSATTPDTTPVSHREVPKDADHTQSYRQYNIGSRRGIPRLDTLYRVPSVWTPPHSREAVIGEGPLYG